MRMHRAATLLTMIALISGSTILTPARVTGQTPAQEDAVVVRTLPNGDRVGTVRKPAGYTASGPLLDRPPTPSGRSDRPPGRTPDRDDGPALPPSDVAESGRAEVRPAAAADLLIKRDTTLTIPTGFSSSVNEPSVGSQGDAIFQTGNWYAAVSTNNGVTFSFIDPETTFPTSPFPFSAGFCCDQRVAQDPSRDLVFWYLQYSATGEGPNDTNGVRIAVAHGAAALASNTWQVHDITPADFGFPLGKWFDFPHLQVSANYLYFTTNVFDTNGDFATDAVIGRIPLANLQSNTPYTMNTFSTSQFFSIAPVHGATSTMYFGSVTGSSTIRVVTWPESSTSPTTTTISGLSASNSSTFICPGPDGLDPCTRASRRMQTGWLTPSELGFMWNSAQGSGRPYPFVRTVILNPATLALVSQPDIWSSSRAYLYPAIAVNARGHLGGQVSALGGDVFPTMNAIIRDNFSPDVVTSGWELYPVATSTHGTAGRWGDYSGAAPHEKYPNTWLGAGHVQEGGSGNGNSRPHNFWFMREQDDPGGTFGTPTPTRTPTATLGSPTPTRTPTRTPTVGQPQACTVPPAAAPPASRQRSASPKAVPPAAAGSAPVARAEGTRRIIAVPDPGGEPGTPRQTGPGWTTITCETFEAGWPTAGWTTFDNNGTANGDFCWGASGFQVRFGQKSAWPASGCTNGVDPSQFFYPNNADSWMIYGPFSLADAAAAEVHFSLWYQLQGTDSIFWGASVDDLTYYGIEVTGASTSTEPPTTSGWQDRTLNMANVPQFGSMLGRSQVWIAFVFQSDASGFDDGPFVDDVEIHKLVGAAPPTATRTPTPPGTGPSATPTRTPTPPTSAIGGRGFTLTRTSSGILLTWQPGTGQTGYLILRLGAAPAVLPVGSPLPAGATSYLDSTSLFLAGTVCYVLLPLGTSPQALSDLLCVVLNTGSATGAPQSFSIRLDQSSVATLGWTAPAGGGQLLYALVPLGPGQTPIVLPATATSATHTLSGPTCYVLLVATAGGIRNTDVLCGVPGVSTLADGAGSAPRRAPGPT